MATILHRLNPLKHASNTVWGKSLWLHSCPGNTIDMLTILFMVKPLHAYSWVFEGILGILTI